VANTADSTSSSTINPLIPSNEKKLWLGKYPEWTMVSNPPFGAHHIDKWYGDRVFSLIENKVAGRRTIFIAALRQLSSAMFFGLFYLTPLHKQSGVAASFGAHMAWTAFASLPPSVMYGAI